MVISIPPITIVLIIIIIGNCIISFGKSSMMNICSIISSSVLSIVGIAEMIIIRSRFIGSLNRNAKTREFDADFVAWAIKKFDSFAVGYIMAICVVIIFLLLYIILNKNRGSFVWTNVTAIVVGIMIINFIIGVWYGLTTINKLFDVAAYILQLSAAGFFTLYIPLAVKRILLRRN